MVKILKTGPEPANEEWFADLKNYALEGLSKPDAIWAYGGPQFLQKLFETYGDRKNTVQIARLIIGFDSELESSSPAGAPKPTDSPDEKKKEQDLAERLQDMVLPRAILLLEGWTAEYVISTSSKPRRWARVRGRFGLSSKDMDEVDSVDAKWNWDRIPKETRSMDLARVVTDIVSDAAKTRFSRVMLNDSERLAKLTMAVIHRMTGHDPQERIESAASLKQNEAALAEGALNVIMALINLGNEAPRDVFHEEDTAGAIRPLVCAKDKYPQLSLQAMRAAALLTQDLYCGMDVADSGILSDLAEMMYEYMAEERTVKQQLADEAAATLVILTKHSACCQKINDDSELTEKLFQVLEAGKHVDNILQVLKNVSTDYPQQFSPEQVKLISDYMDENADASFTLANLASQYDFDMASWDVFNENEIATKAVRLLSRQDMQVQAAAQLLRSLIDQESNLIKASGEPMSTSVVLPEVFLALTASLREPSRSRLAIDELLATIARFLLLRPNPGNEIAVSELEAEISGLTTLALAGNPRAILAASAAFAHNGDNKERVSQYMLSLAQMITPADQTFLKDSMEVVTVLINAGCRLEGFHAKSVMDAVVAIIRAIYVAQLFAEDAPLSDMDQDKVAFVAFDLFEALCADLNNRNYLTNTGIFETIILGSNGPYINDDVNQQAKMMVDRLTNYEDLVAKIEMLRAQVPNSETEPETTNGTQNNNEKLPDVEDNLGEADEVEDDSEDTNEAEDEAQETSPLIPKD
ncbi:hypothetical protein FRC12_008195 [Ceratobasidium sp. 428]|nr:hypothetical protein FRC12_008195 [Ceratobasidium sp. 428]